MKTITSKVSPLFRLLKSKKAFKGEGAEDQGEDNVETFGLI